MSETFQPDTVIADFLFKRISGTSGAAGAYKTLMNLAADSPDQTSTTPGVIMTVTGVGTGTWTFRLMGIYQSSATTTGIKLCANHTGTVGQYFSMCSFPDTSASASTGVGNGLTGSAVGRVPSIYAEQAKDTNTVASVGAAAINDDIPVILEGLMVVTASGDFQIKLGTEVAASAVRLMADSCLELTKVE